MREALVWNGANLVANQLAGAVFFFILASKLHPSAFGVLALALIYTEFFTQQGASALRDAIVQRRDFSAPTLSTIFWCATGVAAIATAMGFFGGGFAAARLNEPALAGILPALSLTIMLAPPIAIAESIVMRDLHFKSLAIRTIAAVWISGLIGLAIVFSPYAEWALVAQRMSQMICSVLFLVVLTRWAPGFSFNTPTAIIYSKSFLQLWATQLLSVFSTQFANLMIGARLGAEALGILRVARKFIEIVHASITSALQSLWVPLLSAVRDHPETRGQMFLKLMSFAALVCIPPLIGLALVSKEITALALSDEYLEANSALMILGVAGIYVPLVYFRSAVLTAMSRNKLAVAVSLFDMILICAVAFHFSRYSLEHTLWAINAGAAITTTVSAYFTVRAVGVPLRSFFNAIAPAYLAAGVMAVAVFAMFQITYPWGDWANIFLKGIVGAAVYAGWLWVFHRAWLMANIRFVMERH